MLPTLYCVALSRSGERGQYKNVIQIGHIGGEVEKKISKTTSQSNLYVPFRIAYSHPLMSIASFHYLFSVLKGNDRKGVSHELGEEN